MTPDRLWRLRPELHHVAAGGAWRAIVAHGLLSTTALLDRHGLAGAERERLERCRRPGAHALHHPDHGLAVLRDQRPLNETALARQLTDGWTTADWRAQLNRLAFLFPTRTAALRFAHVYRDQDNDLLTFATRELLQQAAEDVRVCALNSGAPTARAPTRRGPETFRSLAAFDLVPSRIREVAVVGGLAHPGTLLLRVERLAPGSPPRELWRRGDPLPPSPPLA